MIDPERILALALDGTDEQCVTELGVSRAQVIQRALHLAEDPAVALEYPELVQRIWARVEAGRARRSAEGLQ